MGVMNRLFLFVWNLVIGIGMIAMGIAFLNPPV